MNRILINNVEYPCPLDFSMSKTANIVTEIETMSGDTKYVTNGFKYEDITLKWDWIENSKLQSLLAATSSSFNFTFKDVETGAEKTIEALRRSAKCTESASTDTAGNIVWRGIEISLSFPKKI